MDLGHLTLCYDQARHFKRAMSPHMPYLCELAAQHQTAVEFGTRGGGSTAALLLGIGASLRSYDIQVRPQDKPFWKRLAAAAAAAEKEWAFVIQDASTADIPECDLLLDDSLHQYQFVRDLLERHHSKVRHHIVLHDTATYGEHGQAPYRAGTIGTEPDPNEKGMTAALDEFMAAHPEWAVERTVDFSCGLTTLVRGPR
jgi:hypothetical protein